MSHESDAKLTDSVSSPTFQEGLPSMALEADILFFCFDVAKRDSLETTVIQSLPAVKAAGKPWVLVGCKRDSRTKKTVC